MNKPFPGGNIRNWNLVAHILEKKMKKIRVKKEKESEEKRINRLMQRRAEKLAFLRRSK